MKAGDVIASKYQLVSRIGQGGMGSVWRVTNTTTGRDFAIKFLHSAVAASDDSRMRFIQEARASAQINHPNAIDIFDVGEADDALYLVMELLDGISLGDALRSEPPFSARDLLIVLSEACTALHAAHRAGIVHRDVKPPNIFLHKDRASGFVSAKVLDFGVSKLTNSDDGISTNTGSLLGSPRYMSPEQAISANNTDGRSDIWSIGVVLFEALTGRFPHDGDSSNNLIVAIATKPPKPLSAVAPHLPVPLLMLVDDCLKPVGQRVQSTGLLLDRMLSILQTQDLSDIPLARPTVGKGKMRARPEGLMFRTTPGMIPGLATSMLQAHGLGDLARYLKPGGRDEPTNVMPLSPELAARLSNPAFNASPKGPVRLDVERASQLPAMVPPVAPPPAQTPQAFGASPHAPQYVSPGFGPPPAPYGAYPQASPSGSYVGPRPPLPAGGAPTNALYSQDPMTESISSINVVRGPQQAMSSAPPLLRPTPSSSRAALFAVVGGAMMLLVTGALVWKTMTGRPSTHPAEAATAAAPETERPKQTAIVEPAPSAGPKVTPAPSETVSAATSTTVPPVSTSAPTAALTHTPMAPGPTYHPPPPPAHTSDGRTDIKGLPAF